MASTTKRATAAALAPLWSLGMVLCGCAGDALEPGGAPEPGGGAPELGEAEQAVEPVTTAAVLAMAYEVGVGMMEALDEIAASLEPDRVAVILEQLARIEQELDRMGKVVDAIKAGVDRIEDHLVRQANRAALDEVYDALEHVRAAHTAIQFMQRHPDDTSHALTADIESERGILRFLERRQMVENTGPLISDVRFDHRIAYPAYLVALVTRLAYLELRHGRAAFVQPEIAAELRVHAAHFDWLRAKIEESVQCTATPYATGTRDPWVVECGVFLECRDSIALAPREPNPDPRWHYPTHCIGGAPFNPGFHEEPPERDRRLRYGHEDMARLRDMLNNLARYGRPDGPYVGTFGALTAPIVSSTSGKALDASGLGNGVRPQMSDWRRADPQRWVFEPDGTIRSRQTGQCLDVWGWSTEWAAPVQMWDCHGGNNQRWALSSDGTIRNAHSGHCLSVECWGGACNVDGATLMQWGCFGGPTQQFTTRDPDAPVPR